MPDSHFCPGGPGTAASTGSATLAEQRACLWPGMAGRAGLPLSIWPGVPGPGCADCGPGLPPCPGAAAVPVIGPFSRPGDLVAVPVTGCPALAAATGRDGRRLLGLAGSRGQPGSANRVIGQAALAVTTFSGGLAAGEDKCETGLYPAYQRVLQPGGILAVIGGGPEPGQVPDLAHAVASARAAGLVYAQHIVFLQATIDGGHMRPFPSQDALPRQRPARHPHPR